MESRKELTLNRGRMERAMRLAEECALPREYADECGNPWDAPTVDQAYRRAASYVVSQEDEVRQIIAHLLLQLQRRSALRCAADRDSLPPVKSLMCIGPTASGKTFALRHACKALGLRCTVIDMSCITSSGYKGASLGDFLLEVSRWQEGNKDAVQVVLFDEVDKSARKHSDVDPTFELLKLLDEGDDGFYRGYAGVNDREPYTLSLDDCLFVFAGAFGGIDSVVRSRLVKEAGGSYGMLYDSRAAEAAAMGAAELRRLVELRDLHSYGLPKEFVGRIGRVVSLEALSDDALKAIVKGSPHSLEARYSLLLGGVGLSVSDEAAEGIAEVAQENGMGARMLDTQMQSLMAEALDFVKSAPEAVAVLVDWDAERGRPALSCVDSDGVVREGLSC